MGSGFGSVRHVRHQGFVVFSPAVRAPSHQVEYVIFFTPMIESHSPSLVIVQRLVRTTWSMASPQPTPPTVSPSPSSSTHASTGSISPSLRYHRRATTSTSRPLSPTPLASFLGVYILPCTRSRTVLLGSSWVPPFGLFSTFTWSGSRKPSSVAVG